jgi:hypothetical protein
MRCVMCNRVMQTPGVMIGKFAIGPVCAKKAGLKKLKDSKSVANRDSQTLDMFPTNGQETYKKYVL